MTKENHITSIPYKHIKDELKPKTAEEQCDLYKHQKDTIEKHCLEMGCNGYKLFFCYVKPKEQAGDYQI
jgi:hypothetical protein